MVELPTVEPVRFVSGDTVQWLKDLPDYDPAVWVLTYGFVKDGQRKTVTATNNGDGRFRATISASASGYEPGTYYWQAQVSLGSSQRYTVAQGRVEVLPSLNDYANGYDGRSQVKKTLDALNATLEKKASRDQMQYSINGVAIQRMTMGDILAARSLYARLYKQEVDAEAVANGEIKSNMIRVRF
ncbi:MAG: hypothetical protein OEW37_07210 [Rhodospirillaceae bacterium]|nr:hypothetical protein [Rhodospirillaceae bacterium]